MVTLKDVPKVDMLKVMCVGADEVSGGAIFNAGHR